MIRSLSAVVASFGLAALTTGPLWAADITWRGGTSDLFAERINWGLPSDLPAGLTPEQAESFRRIPGGADRVIVPAGSVVRVTTEINVAASTIAGTLVVDGPDASYNSQRTPATDAVDHFAAVVVRNQGRLFASNDAEFSGQARVESAGRLHVFRNTRFHRLAILGAPANAFGQLRSHFEAPDGVALDGPPIQTVVGTLLELDGETNSLTTIRGSLRVEGEATWRNCEIGFSSRNSQSKAVVHLSRDSRLRLLGGDDQTRWITIPDATIEFGESAELLHGPGLHAFEGNVTFLPVSGGIPSPGQEARPISFRKGRHTFTSIGRLVLTGPIRFEDGSEVTMASPSAGDDGIALLASLGPDGAQRPVEFSGNSQALLLGDLQVGGMIVDGRARIQKPDDRNTTLRVSGDDARLELRGGIVAMDVLVRSNAIVQAGRLLPAEGVGSNPGFRGEMTIEQGGRLAFVGPTNAIPSRAAFEGVCRNLPGGLITVQGGFGASTTLPFAVVNFGEIEIRPPAGPFPQGSGAGLVLGGSLCRTLINDGRVVVLPGATLEVTEGDIFRNGRLELEPEAILAVAETGQSDEFVWTDLDLTQRTNVLGRLFNFSPGASVFLSDTSRVELRGQGAFGSTFDGGASFDVPSGIRINRIDLEMPHLVLGGPSFAKPRVAFGPDPEGGTSSLRVTRRLDWFGGALIGNGEGEARSTGTVAVGQDALCRITFEPTEPVSLGAIHHLGGGITLDVLGGLEINTGNAIRRQDTLSRIILHPGPEAAIQGMIAFDNSNAEWVNRRTVRKTGARDWVLSGPWSNEAEGRVVVDEGRFVVRKGTLQGSRYEVAITGSQLHSEEGTFRDFVSTGGPLTAFRNTRLEGVISVDSLIVGNGLSGEVVLSAADGTTVVVRQGMTWRSNGMDLGRNTEIRLEPGSQNRIESTVQFSPAGIFESGKLVNHGEMTYVANDQSQLRFNSAASIENRGRFNLQFPKDATAFSGRFPANPASGFDFVNRGLLNVFLATSPDADPVLRAQLACELISGLAAQLQISGFPGETRAPLERVLRPAAPIGRNLGEVIFLDRFTLEEGECDFSNCDVRFNDRVQMTGGKLVGGFHGTLSFNAAFGFDGGEMELIGPGRGTFGRITTVRNGARLFLDQDTTLEARPGFNLRDGAALSGFGTVDGGVAVINAIIAPGRNGPDHTGTIVGPLAILTDVSFDALSRLVVDVPVGLGATQSDGLVVSGKAKLNGTLEANALVPTAGELVSGPIAVLDFGTREGDFTTFIQGPIRDGKTFGRSFSEPPDNEMILTLVSDTSADLVLNAEAPLVAATGTELTYLFTVQNRGPEEAPSPVLKVTLPPNARLSGSQPSGTVANGTLTVNLPNQANGETSSVSVVITASDLPASLEIRAIVSSQRPDSAPQNNAVSVITAVLSGGEFRIAKSELNEAGRLRLTFETLTGVNYRLERSSDLKVWTPVREFIGNGTPMQADSLGGDGTQPEFFRVTVVSAP